MLEQIPASEMRFVARTPPPPLRDLVSFWSLSDAPPHARERIVASGTFELVVNLNEDCFRIDGARFSGAIVSGAYRRPFAIDTRDHASILGVHFAPGAAARLLGVPAGELADAHVDLATLWRGSSLREQLCGAKTSDERFRILERALTQRWSRARERHRAVPFALECLARNTPVRAIADRVGLSHRRFIEVFRAEVGMTPKMFARVHRFQRALLRSQRAEVVDWAQLAATSGFADQSHLIRDFVEFSGFSPVELARHRTERVKENHVALG